MFVSFSSHKRRKYPVSNFGAVPNFFFLSIEKGLELFCPSKACLPHKGLSDDFKLKIIEVHINIEMDEKQIEIFE